jgi:regulator of chromosome condensation
MPVNALPLAEDPIRPCLQLFYCSESGDGQHGFGPGAPELGFPKFRRNPKVEANSEAGAYGAVGAGPQTVAAGGLHTLLVDEAGKVRPSAASIYRARLILSLILQIWSCGANDNGALGRVTTGLPNPENPGQILDGSDVQSLFGIVDSLAEEGFRAVKITAGNSLSAAVSADGDVRV